MKKEEIDKLIEESLNKQDAEFYHTLDEQGVFKQWGSIYKGKLGTTAIFVTVIQLIITGFAFWFGYKFFTTEESILMTRYGGAMIIGVIMNGLLKQWHWMQMDKNTILSEMKKMEFQIAILTEKFTELKN